MGELKIKGTAQRRVKYDLMVIKMNFSADGDTPSQASMKVMEECENYLNVIKEKGFDIKKLALSDDVVREESRYKSDDRIDYFEAERELEMRIPFDMRTLNFLRKISDDLELNCLFRTDYELSNTDEIRKELQMEALKSAKEQAEILAEAVGQRVIGLKSADKDAPSRSEEIYKVLAGDDMISCLCCEQEVPYENTNELAAQEIRLMEEIYTVWEIE